MIYEIRLRPTKGRKIYVDPGEREGIYLYPAEIRKAGLRDGRELTDSDFEELRRLYALPRAKKRALGILTRRDKTEQELRDKLEESMTDSFSVDEAISYLKQYGYVDDYRYASEYIYYKRSKKSFRQIRADLRKKGIPSDILEQAFEESGGQEEEDIRQLFDKYIRRFEEMDSLARQKTYAHFARKGYDRELIGRLIRLEDEDRA